MLMPTQKRTIDNERQAKEREPLPAPGNYNREEFTRAWGDDITNGVLKQLYINDEPLTSTDIGRMILWGWRKVDDVIRALRNKYNKDIIIQAGKIRVNKSKKHFNLYKLNEIYRQGSFELLVTNIELNIAKNSISSSINGSEKITDEILNRLKRGWFRYTGSGKDKYKIGDFYPDFIDEKRGIVVEFNGFRHYPPCLNPLKGQGSTYKEHIEIRRLAYAKWGWVYYPIGKDAYNNKSTQTKLEDDLLIFLEKNKDRSLKGIQKMINNDQFNTRHLLIEEARSYAL